MASSLRIRRARDGRLGQGLAEGGRSRSTVLLLLAALLLAVLSFVVTTSVIAEQRARNIEDAADRIASSAMPSIEHLAGARSDLRLMEGLAIEHAHLSTEGRDASDLVPRIERARAALGEKWALAKATPVFPGAQALWGDIEAALEDVDAAMKLVLGPPRRGDPSKEAIVYDALRPSVDRLAEALLVTVRFNAARGEALAARITAARIRQQTISAILNGAGAVFTLLASTVLVLVLSGYMAKTERRISDLDLFAARVAHDVRSPLTYVAFAIDLARRRSPIGDDDRVMLERASRSIQRVGQIVEALLLVAAANVAEARDAKVELRALAREEIDEILPQAQEKGVEITLDPFDPVEVACSPGALACILSNLLGNALKYIADCPRRLVRVSARVKGEQVRIEVSDTGPGVPAELRGRLFNPYVRAHSASIPGLGLGLATVRRLVDAYQGEVGLDDNPGGGSRFWVELPRAFERRAK